MDMDLITINFAAILGIVFMLVFLRQNGEIETATKKKFYILISLELIEMVVYSAELITATLDHPTVWRILLSIIGYSIRPLLLYLILMISLRADLNKTRKKLLFIPELINILVVCTALFSDIAFGYTPDNVFYRGALGYCAHVILFLYIFVLLVFTIRDSIKRKTFEQAIIYLMSFVIILTVVIEAIFSIRSIGRTAMIMCTVFYYMYFQTQEYNEELKKGHLKIKGLSTKVDLDPMTKLYNKEAFHNYCLKSIKENQSDSLAFLFIDLDHFKQINDTFGHMKGDQAIIDTAFLLKNAFQDNDIVGRFGGDEFCICLRNLSYDNLTVKLEYIHKIAKHEYWDADHTKSIAVTCSIGAVYYENCASIAYENMIVEADRAVYTAKKNGRNQTCVIKM